jgi:16S rRNA (cytosine967-C5)-methyltransferase
LSDPTPARRVAYEVLRRVFEHGAYADRSLRSALVRAGVTDGRERSLAQRLAYGAVQRRGTTDHVAAELAARPVAKIDPPLIAALRLGLFELLFDDGAAAHAAVDQAVELAKGGRDGGRRHRGAGLVNAVMRRAAREGTELVGAIGEATPAEAALRHSIPTWIAELWWRERGPNRARALMAAANRPPERTYRSLAEGAAERLRSEGVELKPVTDRPNADRGSPALIRVSGGNWEAVEGAIAAGLLLPQSPGSALAAAVLGVSPGDRVLDLCAAPGIKTTQLAAAAGADGSVIAVERDAGRAAQLAELCGRVGAGSVELLVGDGTELELGSGYDRVLVDAPCTGLGTLASRPDARWRRTEADVPELADLQSQLLGRGLAALRPGGALVYSVCTISDAEGRGVVSRVLGGESGGVDARLDDLGSGRPGLVDSDEPRCLQLLPGRDRGDGFFIARMVRAA